MNEKKLVLRKTQGTFQTCGIYRKKVGWGEHFKSEIHIDNSFPLFNQ